VVARERSRVTSRRGSPATRRHLHARPAFVVATLVLVAANAAGMSACGGTSRPSSSPSALFVSPLPESGSPLPSASPAATRPPGALSVEDYGAVGDGKTDDTQAVIDAAQAAAVKGVAVWLPSGTYAIGDVPLPPGSVLAGAGADGTWLRGRVTFAGGSEVSDLRIGRAGAATRLADGASHTAFRRVTFVGGGGMESGEDQGVIRFSAGRAASDIRFVDCVIGANSADGNGVSMVSSGRPGATYRDITWERCLFKGSPRMNVEVIQRSDGAGPMDAGYARLDLIDCTFEPSGSENVSFDAVGPAGDCVISGCTFYGAGWNLSYPYGQGIEFNGPRGMRFVGNTVYRCRGAMINHSGVPGVRDGTVIQGNTFDGTRTYIGVTPDRTAQTIFFSGVDDAMFRDNAVRTDVGGELLYLDESSANRFVGNTWTDARPQGKALACAVLTDASSSNSFVGDRFNTASGHAVLIQNGSDGTVFRACAFLPSDAQGGNASRISVEPGLTVSVQGNPGAGQ
jgi:hypothetical protein